MDPDVPAVATYLNVKDAILDRAGVGTGDRVRVTGSIAAELFRGEMSVRLQVIAIEHEAPEAVPQQRTENLTIDTLRQLALDRRSFPSVSQPTVALIHSAAPTARALWWSEHYCGKCSCPGWTDTASSLRSAVASLQRNGFPG